MTPRLKFLRNIGSVALALGIIIGALPPYVGERFIPECGTALFRGLPVDLCTNALITPTIFSLLFAVPGIAMLIWAAAMKLSNSQAER
jgi:hypothetical protein